MKNNNNFLISLIIISTLVACDKLNVSCNYQLLIFRAIFYHFNMEVTLVIELDETQLAIYNYSSKNTSKETCEHFKKITTIKQTMNTDFRLYK